MRRGLPSTTTSRPSGDPTGTKYGNALARDASATSARRGSARTFQNRSRCSCSANVVISRTGRSFRGPVGEARGTDRGPGGPVRALELLRDAEREQVVEHDPAHA